MALLELRSGLAFGLLPVDKVETSCFGFAVNKGSCKPSEEFLSLLMALGLAIRLAVLFVRFGSLERSGAGDELVRD